MTWFQDRFGQHMPVAILPDAYDDLVIVNCLKDDNAGTTSNALVNMGFPSTSMTEYYSDELSLKHI